MAQRAIKISNRKQNETIVNWLLMFTIIQTNTRVRSILSPHYDAVKHKLWVSPLSPTVFSRTSLISVWHIYTINSHVSIQISRCQIKARIMFPVVAIMVVGLNWYVILLHSKRPHPRSRHTVSVRRIRAQRLIFVFFPPTGSFSQLEKATRRLVTKTLQLQWTTKFLFYIN